MSALDELDEEGVKKVRGDEAGSYGRKTILRKAEQLLESEEAPVEDYFDRTAREIIERLDEMPAAELRRTQELRGRA